jgi:long-chain fatty acid transport protein
MRKIHLLISLLPFWVLLEIVSTASSALASGFAILEQSAGGLGNAFSQSAAAEDPSTIFFNPAGLTRLKGSSVTGAGLFIFPSVIFKNQGSAIVTGAPLTGSNGGNGGVTIFVPSVYGVWDVSSRVKIGLGVNSPFGLKTRYNDGWVGRYQAVNSELTTVNINPTLAAKLTNNLSFGVGVNLQHAEATLSNAIDFGLIGFGNGLGTRPQGADGFVKLTGNDWSWGYNLGLLYEPSQKTRIGLAYRSSITHDLRGNANFTVPAAARALTATGRFADTGAKTVLNLPDTLSLSGYHQLSPRLAVTADVTRTGWSSFKELRVKFDNPVEPDNVQPENWHDTFRYSLGLKYALNQAWQLRAGVAYDETPVDDKYRTPRIPDSNRTWLAVGASLKVSDSLSFDFGYSHIFVDDASINLASTTQGTLKGKFDSQINIFGAQLNWRF